MPRERTGTLVLRATGYFARVRVDVRNDDGTVTRRREWIDLETKDRMTARRKLQRLTAAVSLGEVVAVAREAMRAPTTVADASREFVELRKAKGKRMWSDEDRNFRLHILPVIGTEKIEGLRPVHVREVLETGITKGLQRGTISHLRRLLFRFCNWLFEAERIAENPVARVALPDAKVDKRRRVRPTDEEMWQYLRSPPAGRSPREGLELKMLAISSRIAGGMRTVETIRWTWEMIDLETFARCWLPRAKGAEPQQLDIPPVLAPFLREWWERQGCPPSGPIFPVTKGERKGQPKKERGTSFARRLRRDFLRAGVVRHRCSRPPSAKPVSVGEPCCPGYATDPLYSDTATTRRADFHSFRRAFASATARANVNAQQAMALTGHTDMRTHQRYLVDAMTTIPTEALPSWDPANAQAIMQQHRSRQRDQSPRRTTNHAARERRAATGTDDAGPRNDDDLGVWSDASGAEGQWFESTVARPFGDPRWLHVG